MELGSRKRKRRKTWLFKGFYFHRFINVPNRSCISGLPGDTAVRSRLEMAAGHVVQEKSYLEPGAEPAVLEAAVPVVVVWLYVRWMRVLGTERTGLRAMYPEMPAAARSRAVFGVRRYTITAKVFCV